MSQTPLYTVTITLADQEDGSVEVSMAFDPSVSKKLSGRLLAGSEWHQVPGEAR